MTKNKGSLLIFVLWTLAIIAIFTVSVGFAVRQRLQAIGRLQAREALRDIAEAGVFTAMDVLANPKENSDFADRLNDSWSINPSRFHEIEMGRGFFSVDYKVNGERYDGVVDEESKINLNHVEDENILVRLFKQVTALDETTARSIAASILDWRDADENAREGGAESAYYHKQNPPYESKNTPFDSLEELLLVQGMTPDILEQVRSCLTVWSSGKINLNTASEAVLTAWGMNPAVSEHIIFYRAGGDGAERTKDDRAFENLDTVVDSLRTGVGLKPDEESELSEFLTQGTVSTMSENFLVQSTSHLNHQPGFLIIRCVTDRQGKVRFWHETFKA